MSDQKKYQFYLVLMIVAAALSRLIPHPMNFTPLTALSLFGVCYMRKSWQAFLIPLAALLLSDSILGFYPYVWSVYASLLCISLYGYFYVRNFSFTGKVFSLLPASLFFFFITNSAAFFYLAEYPKTLSGYFLCLIAGIPFYKNALAGDLFYALTLFGTAEFLKNKLLPQKVPSYF